jgi:hypothetical protein
MTPVSHGPLVSLTCFYCKNNLFSFDFPYLIIARQNHRNEGHFKCHKKTLKLVPAANSRHTGKCVGLLITKPVYMTSICVSDTIVGEVKLNEPEPTSWECGGGKEVGSEGCTINQRHNKSITWTPAP